MARVSSRGNSWRIWWYIGKDRKFASISKTIFPKKKDAENESHRREFGGILTKDTPFKDFALQVLEGKRPSDRTREVFLETVNHFDNFMKARSLQFMGHYSEALINEYKNEAKGRGRSSSAINRDIDYLKEIGKSAFSKQIISNFNERDIKGFPFVKKNWILPTREEREGILKWFKTNEPYFYAWMYFIITRGWRRDEFRTMLVKDFIPENEILYIQKAKTEPRTAKLTQEDCRVLNEHIILLKKIKKYNPDGLMYPPLIKGNFIGSETLNNRLKKACKDLKIAKHITPHLFRHWVVTNILDNTANVEVVKAITGHKDSQTIFKYYAHATPENVARGLEITRIDTGFVPKAVPKKG